ncbi:MAG: class I SAM-dependent methyltransferase [Beutenbergiaceae bacterium]
MRAGFWRIYAACYDLAWDSPATTALAQRIARELPVRTLVDVGCGTGLTAAPLVARGVRVHGVDASPAMLRRARNADRISAGSVQEASATGLAAQSVDAALCANVLHLHPAPAAVLDELVRLVRPGGRIAVVTPADGLQHRTVLRADLKSGRGLVRSVIAHLTRQMIGLVAAVTGISVRDGSEVRAHLDDAVVRHALHVIAQGEVAELQRFTVMAVPD